MLLVAAAVSLASCGEDGWQPGKESNYSGINVYFVQPDAYSSLPIDATGITFSLERDDAPYEDQYVPLTLTSAHPEAFRADEAAFFWAGELTSEVTVSFTDRMEPFKEYSFSLAVDEDYTQQYLEQTSYPRIDVTVVREDFEVVHSCRYTCGGVTLGLINWTSASRVVDLEYSEMSDTYRFDPWGHGNYVRFTVGEAVNRISPLTLNAQSYNTGEIYENGSETADVTATVSGDCSYNSRRRTYTFTFTYGFTGQSYGESEDELLILD